MIHGRLPRASRPGGKVSSEGDLLHVVTNDTIPEGRKRFGRAIIWGTVGLTLIVAVMQKMKFMEQAEFGFTYERPTLYSFRV